jgi:hypothetical protein
MQDTYGLLPPSIRARYEREEFVDRAANGGRGLNAALKALDPDLSCVFVRADIAESELPVNAARGRWHVRRHNPPPHAPTFIPILAPGGGYRDPDSGVLDELRDRDLRRPEIMQRELHNARSDGGKKHKELEAEQRRDEMRADFRAAKRVAGEGGLHKRKWDKGKKAKV